MTSCNFGSWTYLSFQDDNHLNLKQDISQYGWIYLSFQDDNHRFAQKAKPRISWIYLSFQDDNHPINNNCLLYN